MNLAFLRNMANFLSIIGELEFNSSTKSLSERSDRYICGMYTRLNFSYLGHINEKWYSLSITDISHDTHSLCLAEWALAYAIGQSLWLNYGTIVWTARSRALVGYPFLPSDMTRLCLDLFVDSTEMLAVKCYPLLYYNPACDSLSFSGEIGRVNFWFGSLLVLLYIPKSESF